MTPLHAHAHHCSSRPEFQPQGAAFAVLLLCPTWSSINACGLTHYSPGVSELHPCPQEISPGQDSRTNK